MISDRHRFVLPGALGVFATKQREGPKLVFLVHQGASTRCFDNPNDALEYIAWPDDSPIASQLSDWFDQFLTPPPAEELPQVEEPSPELTP